MKTHDRADLTDEEFRLFKRMLQELGQLDRLSRRNICAALNQEIVDAEARPKAWPAFSITLQPPR